MKTLHDFTAPDIYGDDFDFAELKGKKVMIVNTASECGFTYQYEGMQQVYKDKGGDSFELIAFPANNFGGQEPGENDEIAEFCSRNFEVTFPMMSKVSVKGDDIHPLFDWLTHHDQNGVADIDIKWNFQKFLIDEEGKLVRTVAHDKEPFDEEILSWIG